MGTKYVVIAERGSHSDYEWRMVAATDSKAEAEQIEREAGSNLEALQKLYWEFDRADRYDVERFLVDGEFWSGTPTEDYDLIRELADSLRPHYNAQLKGMNFGYHTNEPVFISVYEVPDTLDFPGCGR